MSLSLTRYRLSKMMADLQRMTVFIWASPQSTEKTYINTLRTAIHHNKFSTFYRRQFQPFRSIKLYILATTLFLPISVHLTQKVLYRTSHLYAVGFLEFLYARSVLPVLEGWAHKNFVDLHLLWTKVVIPPCLSSLIWLPHVKLSFCWYTVDWYWHQIVSIRKQFHMIHVQLL